MVWGGWFGNEASGAPRPCALARTLPRRLRAEGLNPQTPICPGDFFHTRVPLYGAFGYRIAVNAACSRVYAV